MVLGVDLFFALFNNLAMFIALVAIYNYLIVQLNQSTWYKRQFYLGLVFGVFAIGCMYARIPVYEGVIVDQRNAIIALSGVFGGPVAAYISAVCAGLFRLSLGGQGAFAGVIGAFLAATSGIVISRFQKPFGTIQRAAASALFATLVILPGFLFVEDFQVGLALMTSVSAPYGLAIFLSIFLVGLLLQREENKIEVEQLLLESEARFHKMFQEHKAVMLLLDYDSGTIVDANGAACHYYGYRREALVSAPMTKINTLSMPEIMSLFQQANEKKQHYFEVKHRLATGEIRNVEVYTSPIKVGSRSLLFSIVHDTTQRKEAESELETYKNHLEELVEKQTRKLKETHAELLQAERLATLGKLTATVSHELRNPLGSIQNALFLFDDHLERNEPRQMTLSLELAKRNIERCVNIIEELNRYARVKDLDISEEFVDEWLRGVIDEHVLPDGILCELALSCGVRAAFDKEKLRQVVVNLIANSIHALQEKQGSGKFLRVSTHLLDDKYVISFSDNGVGMSSEVKEKVFEPLFSTKGFGVGIGMAIVKNIVGQHHGEIDIDSHEGEGSTITLRLPIKSLRVLERQKV